MMLMESSCAPWKDGSFGEALITVVVQIGVHQFTDFRTVFSRIRDAILTAAECFVGYHGVIIQVEQDFGMMSCRYLRVRGMEVVTFAVIMKAIGLNILRASRFRKWKNTPNAPSRGTPLAFFAISCLCCKLKKLEQNYFLRIHYYIKKPYSNIGSNQRDRIESVDLAQSASGTSHNAPRNHHPPD